MLLTTSTIDKSSVTVSVLVFFFHFHWFLIFHSLSVCPITLRSFRRNTAISMRDMNWGELSIKMSPKHFHSIFHFSFIVPISSFCYWSVNVCLNISLILFIRNKVENMKHISWILIVRFDFSKNTVSGTKWIPYLVEDLQISKQFHILSIFFIWLHIALKGAS
jgi:hypothetical protein